MSLAHPVWAEFIFNILLLFGLSVFHSFNYVMLLHFIEEPIESENQHSISSPVAFVEIYGWGNWISLPVFVNFVLDRTSPVAEPQVHRTALWAQIKDDFEWERDVRRWRTKCVCLPEFLDKKISHFVAPVRYLSPEHCKDVRVTSKFVLFYFLLLWNVCL